MERYVKMKTKNEKRTSSSSVLPILFSGGWVFCIYDQGKSGVVPKVREVVGNTYPVDVALVQLHVLPELLLQHLLQLGLWQHADILPSQFLQRKE